MPGVTARGSRRACRCFGSLVCTVRVGNQSSATLNRLALPEVATAIESFERSVQDGAFRSFKKIRVFSRSIHAASSFEEATLAAAL